MLSLHHTHLMTSDVEATIRFWCDHFAAEIVADEDIAGARNVFLRVGEGRLHLYAQAPKHLGQGTVHHLGIETDDLVALTTRLKSAGISVSEIRHHAAFDYAMAEAPDKLLLELFQPKLDKLNDRLRKSGYFASASIENRED
jgi:catechol 2,3-dioxygenase-like lactoylglutathione lyase family enzyme